MEKLKFGFYWAASCGGCEIAVLDVDEKILDVLQIADVVFWPVAMDVKVQGRRGDGGWLHGRLLLQRRHTQLGAGAPREAAAEEGEVHGRLRRLRPARRSPRPRQPQQPRRTSSRGSTTTTESTDNKAGTEPQPKHNLPEGKLRDTRLPASP